MPGCPACPHPELKRVGGEWHRADGSGPIVAVVGISPWKEEVRQSRPFVGPSGRLLRAWLDRGERRAVRFYLTNAVHCSLLKPGRELMEACAPRLLQELLEVQPNAVLLLGDVAAKTYARVAGSWVHTQAVHPSGVVRRIVPYRRWMDQMDAAWQRLRVYLRGEEATPIRVTSDVTWALDTEFKARAHDGFDLAVLSNGRERYVCHPDEAGIARLRDALERCDALVLHHAVLDLIALRGRGVTVPDRVPVHCTMTAQGLLHPGSSRDLKIMAQLRGWVYPEIDIGAWRRGKVPDDIAEAYCANDTLATLGIWEDVSEEAIAHPLYRETYQPLLRVLAYQMAEVPVDRARVQRLVSEHEAKQTQIEEQLAAVASLNWRSTRQVAEYLKAQGIEIPETDQGNPRADEETLKELMGIAPAHRATIAHVLLLRHYDAVLKRYLYPWQQYGALATVYDPTGTRWGRMASRDSNAQNIPEQLRQCLVAPDGRWVNGDLKQAEFVVAAWMSGDGEMMRACESGDFHTANATALLGRPPQSKEERRHFKPIGFGLLYLGTPWTVRKNLKLEMDIEISEDDANRFYVRFWDLYRGYLHWIERVKAEAAKGLVISPFGRAYPTRALRDLEAVRFLINGLIQGATGDLTARALVRACRAGIRPLVEVHDNIGASASPGDAAQVAIELKRQMEADVVPIEAEVSVTERWAEPEEAYEAVATA